MPVAPLVRRTVLLAAALLAVLLLGSASAQAKDCKVSGNQKTCLSVLKESCSPGPPYRCRTSRDVSRYVDGKFVGSEYSARRRTCRGFAGTKCSLDYKTFCASTTSDKRCRTDSATSCRSGDNGKATTCRRTVDSCRTSLRSSYYACSYTVVVERCTDTLCRTARTVCRSGSNKGKKCFALFSEGPGRTSDSSGSGSGSGEEDPPASTGDDAPAPSTGDSDATDQSVDTSNSDPGA